MLLRLHSVSIHFNSIAHMEPERIRVAIQHHPHTHTHFLLMYQLQKPSASRSFSFTLPKSHSAEIQTGSPHVLHANVSVGVTKRGLMPTTGLLHGRPQQKAAKDSRGRLIQPFPCLTINVCEAGKKKKSVSHSTFSRDTHILHGHPGPGSGPRPRLGIS